MAFLTGIAQDGTAATLTKATLQANKVYYYAPDVSDVTSSVIKITLTHVYLDITSNVLTVRAVDNNSNVYILPADSALLYATDTAAETAINNAFAAKIATKVDTVVAETSPIG